MDRPSASFLDGPQTTRANPTSPEMNLLARITMPSVEGRPFRIACPTSRVLYSLWKEPLAVERIRLRRTGCAPCPILATAALSWPSLVKAVVDSWRQVPFAP